jgi:hypothetical protein
MAAAMSIEQVKTYRIKCDGYYENPALDGQATRCPVDIIVKAVNRFEALAVLPHGWTVQYPTGWESSLQTFCYAKHVDRKD